MVIIIYYHLFLLLMEVGCYLMQAAPSVVTAFRPTGKQQNQDPVRVCQPCGIIVASW